MADAPDIRFEWDDAKNDRCLRDRGVGFAGILPAFLDPDRRVERDVRRGDGEARLQLEGPDINPLMALSSSQGVKAIDARSSSSRIRQHLV
jgi:uncharacterized protein